MTQQSSYIVNTLLNSLICSAKNQSQLNQTKKIIERKNLLKYGKQINEKFVDQLNYHKNGYPTSQKNKNNTSNIRAFRRSCNDAEIYSQPQGEQQQKLDNLNIKIRPQKRTFHSIRKIQSHKKIQSSVNTSPENKFKLNHCRAFTQELIKLDQTKPLIDQDCQQKRRIFLKRKALQKQVQNSFNAFQQNKFVKSSFKNLYYKTQRAQQYVYKQGVNFDVVIASSAKNKSNINNLKTLQQRINVEDRRHNKQNNSYLSNNACQNRIQFIRNKKKHIKTFVKDSQNQQISNQIDKNRNSQDLQVNLNNPNIQIIKNVTYQQRDLDKNQKKNRNTNKRGQNKKSTQISSLFIDVESIIKNLKFSKGVFADRIQNKDQEQVNAQQCPFPFLHKNCQKYRRNTKRLSQRMSSNFKNSTHRNNE